MADWREWHVLWHVGMPRFYVLLPVVGHSMHSDLHESFVQLYVDKRRDVEYLRGIPSPRLGRLKGRNVSILIFYGMGYETPTVFIVPQR